MQVKTLLWSSKWIGELSLPASPGGKSLCPVKKAEGDCPSEVAGMLKGIQRGENIPVSNIYRCLAPNLTFRSDQN